MNWSSHQVLEKSSVLLLIGILITVAIGGSEISALAGWPWDGSARAVIAPRLPRPLPP